MATVLIVDDSPVARHVLGARLRAEGLRVREAGSAASAEGIGSIESLLCAVLDVELGDGDGIALAATLRARRATLPIAYFTGADGALRGRAAAHGPVFSKDDLGALVAWVVALQPPPTK